jgi:rhodanese-related sulfurtransferase
MDELNFLPKLRSETDATTPQTVPNTMSDITSEELKKRQAAGEKLVILDVREGWEYEESRIEGSQHIPLGSLPQRVDELEDFKEGEVIVHCKGGSRSNAAKAFLAQNGFRNVRNLIGGITAYQQ